MIKFKTVGKYVADFETYYDEKTNNTFVWLWAICNTNDTDEIYWGESIESFFECVETLKNNSIIYFHNLKYDGSYILNYILNQNYKQTKERKVNAKEFNSLVSDQGQYYHINISIKNKNYMFLDSLKKLPFKVEVIAKQLGYEHKGDLDYKKEKQRKYTTEYYTKFKETNQVTLEDLDYIRRDVQIIAKALKEMFFNNDLYAETIGSDCLKYFKKTNKRFNDLFPLLTPDVDAFCREAYIGGFCYVNPKIQGKKIKKHGSTYDYNSMYPSVMHSKSGYRYPVGYPEYFTGEPPKDKLCVVHIKITDAILKPNKFPNLIDKASFLQRDNVYTDFIEGTRDYYLSNEDLDLTVENYDISNIEFIDGYAFESMIGLFDSYIDHWYKVKEEATIKGDKVMRQLAKLFLNNLYGKFGQSSNASYKEFYIDDDNKLNSNAIYDEKNTLYVPVALFITSYARRELFNAMNANSENFCYCDTDSIHLTKTTAEGIKVHDSALNSWKKESEWTEAKFLRCKTYYELIDGNYDIKCCGMPDNIKNNMNIKDFKVGSVFDGKLVQKQKPGGVILEETTFKIKAL